MDSFRSWIVAITVSGFVFGCSSNQHEDRHIEANKGTRPLAELTDLETEVFPLPNGNAYLVSNLDQQLFLLSEGRAKRVDNVDLSGIEATVYTLPTGSAYLVSSDGQHLRLYFLVGDKATLVQEGVIPDDAIQRAAKSSDAYQWSQTQAALIGKRRAVANNEQAMAPDDDRE
jgi:hypothetical protein